MHDRVVSLLADKLISSGLKVTCAESCTGGGIAEALTTIPGSSKWFGYGFVTYANEAKVRVLGVSESTLANQGAVSEDVVAEMAAGALVASGADIAVAVSGIAGPDGGSAEKPVGMVCIGWKFRTNSAVTRCFYFTGNRAEIRAQAVEEGLKGLVKIIDEQLG